LKQVEVAGLQKIHELEARAVQRADALDAIRRTLRAQRSLPTNTNSVVDRGHAKRSDDMEDQTESLRRDEARAEARFKIAVDELLAAHCETLRLSAWGQGLLVPAEEMLLAANESYHPWDRALRFGKRAIEELQSLELAGTASERDAARDRARDAIQGFRNGIDLLGRARPESEILLLESDLIGRWGTGFEISNAMADVKAQCTAEKAAVATAQAHLEVANQQIVAAAWAKIPARLRP
jgi:hypothetical protein